MTKQRTDRLNSLLKEVLAEVIRRDVDNPDVDDFVTVTRVDITRDLRHAKVYISTIKPAAEKKKTVDALQAAAGFIAVTASKKVCMRYFPELRFFIDDTVDKVMRIDEVLTKIHQNDDQRKLEHPESASDEDAFEEDEGSDSDKENNNEL